MTQKWLSKLVAAHYGTLAGRFWRFRQAALTCALHHIAYGPRAGNGVCSNFSDPELRLRSRLRCRTVPYRGHCLDDSPNKSDLHVLPPCMSYLLAAGSCTRPQPLARCSNGVSLLDADLSGATLMGVHIVRACSIAEACA